MLPRRSRGDAPGQPEHAPRLHPWTPVGFGVAVMGVLTLIFRHSDLDLAASAAVYQADPPHWPLASRWPFPWIHWIGAWPGVTLLAGAAAGWIASYRWPERRRWRRPCLFIVGVILLGPGLLINRVCKPLL